MYQNRDFNKIRIVFGYEFLLYTLVAISIDSDNFTCYLNPIIIILYKAGFPLVTSARQTKKENAAGRQIADPRKGRRRENPTFLILLKRRVVV